MGACLARIISSFSEISEFLDGCFSRSLKVLFSMTAAGGWGESEGRPVTHLVVGKGDIPEISRGLYSQFGELICFPPRVACASAKVPLVIGGNAPSTHTC